MNRKFVLEFVKDIILIILGCAIGVWMTTLVDKHHTPRLEIALAEATVGAHTSVDATLAHMHTFMRDEYANCVALQFESYGLTSDIKLVEDSTRYIAKVILANIGNRTATDLRLLVSTQSPNEALFFASPNVKFEERRVYHGPWGETHLLTVDRLPRESHAVVTVILPLDSGRVDLSRRLLEISFLGSNELRAGAVRLDSVNLLRAWESERTIGGAMVGFNVPTLQPISPRRLPRNMIHYVENPELRPDSICAAMTFDPFVDSTAEASIGIEVTPTPKISPLLPTSVGAHSARGR